MGSGKSTVARALRDLGYVVLDADAVVGLVLGRGEAAVNEIRAAFGDAVMAADGSLNRRALAARVFDRPDQLAILEAIIHPRVRERVARERARLEADGQPVAFYDVPLLFEKNMQAQFDSILVVRAPRELRLARAMARTGLTAAEIEARWANQMAPEEKEARASAIIPNDGDEVHLRRAVGAVLDDLGVPRPRL